MSTKKEWLSLQDLVEKFIIEISDWEKSFDFCFINKYYIKQIDEYTYEVHSIKKSKYYLHIEMITPQMFNKIELKEMIK